MDDSKTFAPQARLFVGMGGSGVKTLASFSKLLTEHGKEAAKSEIFMAYLLVDTDGAELAEFEKQIRQAYSRIHREPIIRTVHLSADITDFSSFVGTKLLKGGHHDRLREVWWYRENRQDNPEPFTALNLKDSPTRGAGQCPLVSTFLAWNQMLQIDAVIEDVLNELKNRSVQGSNQQNWTLEVALVASLAGGTGRGCWHLVASKIREKLRDLNQRPKPVGFFFDSSVFAETVKKEEQFMKLRVNSITGVSELTAWLRNEYERDSDLTPFQFRLPSLENPGAESSDLIDTTKLNVTVAGDELHGASGRSPISAAYLIFGAGKQGTLGDASAYFQSVANALYARLFGSTGSTNINEAGHLNGLAAATISVPIAGIREYVQEYVRQFLPEHFSSPNEASKIEKIVDTLFQGFKTSDATQRVGDALALNVPQRIYKEILDQTSPGKTNLEKNLREGQYDEAAAKAKAITYWPTNNDAEIGRFVSKDVVNQIWGPRETAESAPAGGALQLLGIPTELDKSQFHRIYGGSETITAENPIAEALHLLLKQGSVELQTGNVRERIDITSYGTKRAIAVKVVDRLKTMLAAISNRSSHNASQSKAQMLIKPADELTKARTGLFKTSVTVDERDTIMSRVEPWLLSQSDKSIDKHFGELLGDAMSRISSLVGALEAVETSLSKITGEQRSKTERSRENNFWTEKDFDSILSPEKSAFDRGILSAQTLQSEARDENLLETFHDVMKKHSLAGFVEARRGFIEAVQRWIDAGTQSTDSLQMQTRKLRDILETHLAKMTDQFMLPADFYETNFGFFETVRRLMGAWCKKLNQRAGSPQDIAKLRQWFENQFGVTFPVSSDGGPKQLDEGELTELAEDACRAMAIRLGGRTDPLFQQRFDEGERPTYDSVAVVLPTQKKFDDEYAKDIDREAKANHQFAGAGHFKAIPTTGKLDAGNPYTMFAYATQQFEDWRRDAGMARIASLEYYKTPAVLSWLRACEAPSGASVFLDAKELKTYGIESCRDIYGLGYISPLFVHNPTLKEMRWSPWDESKVRSADKRNERFDLLAYALLEPPSTDASKYSPKHFNAVLKKAAWPMPLLTFRSPPTADSTNSWYFTRPAFRHCTEVLAQKERDANNTAFAANHGYISIRRCVDEILENDVIAAAIAGEASIFMSEVLCSNDYADDFDPCQDISVAYRYLGDRLTDIKKQQEGPAAEKMKKLIDELLKRVAELAEYTPERLKEHYALIKTNSELNIRA